MFHGIQELEQDGQGYVYWRGRHVEHFSYERHGKEERKAAEQLAARCRHLEQIGAPVNVGTAIWRWGWFATMQPGDPWRGFLAGMVGNLWEYRPACPCGPAEPHAIGCVCVAGKVAWEVGGRILAWDRERGTVEPIDVRYEEYNAGFYHTMHAAGWRAAEAGQAAHNGLCYATLEGLKALFARHGLTPGTAPVEPIPDRGPDPHSYRCACCGADFESHKPQDPNQDTGYGHCTACRRRHPGLWSKEYA